MKVSELISLLSTFDPEADVVIPLAEPGIETTGPYGDIENVKPLSVGGNTRESVLLASRQTSEPLERILKYAERLPGQTLGELEPPPDDT